MATTREDKRQPGETARNALAWCTAVSSPAFRRRSIKPGCGCRDHFDAAGDHCPRLRPGSTVQPAPASSSGSGRPASAFAAGSDMQDSGPEPPEIAPALVDPGQEVSGGLRLSVRAPPPLPSQAVQIRHVRARPAAQLPDQHLAPPHMSIAPGHTGGASVPDLRRTISSGTRDDLRPSASSAADATRTPHTAGSETFAPVRRSPPPAPPPG
jgi:hypothetical protein